MTITVNETVEHQIDLQFPLYWKDSAGYINVLFTDKEKCLVVTNYPHKSEIQEGSTMMWLGLMIKDNVPATTKDFAQALVTATSRFESYYTPELLEAEVDA